jgi:hypothetical protein
VDSFRIVGTPPPVKYMPVQEQKKRPIPERQRDLRIPLLIYCADLVKKFNLKILTPSLPGGNCYISCVCTVVPASKDAIPGFTNQKYSDPGLPTDFVDHATTDGGMVIGYGISLTDGGR